MSSQNAWVRLLVWVVCAAIAVQLVVAVIRPLVPYLLVGAAIVALACVVRWWRSDRW